VYRYLASTEAACKLGNTRQSIEESEVRKKRKLLITRGVDKYIMNAEPVRGERAQGNYARNIHKKLHNLLCEHTPASMMGLMPR
jgi:hypothetical protein